MPHANHRRCSGSVIVACSAALLAACAAQSGPTVATSDTPIPVPTVPSATVAVPPTAPAARTKNWFDLDAGDCLADPPPVDPNVIAVPLVDCATAHRAEVYLRRPMAVNTALADVADRDCDQGFLDYTGQRIGGTPFAVTYLIDSNQNRTQSNPNPSTVICLLVPSDGQALTGSARR